VNDWAIRELPRPSAFIQWKGTEVCADYYCLCGEQFHIDAEFAYYVQCHHCQRRYQVSSVIELREMSPEEEPDADCKVDEDARLEL
jgi:hypothetical protein